jgi:hypothetical protein
MSSLLQTTAVPLHAHSYIYDNVDLLGAPGAAKALTAGGRLTAAGPQGLDPANGRWGS